MAVPLPASAAALQDRLAEQHYVADRALAVSLFLALKLQRPLFLEGEAGVGKTSLAAAMAAALDTDLIRLQCYEGLDVTLAVYEWDYARQILELKILDAAGAVDRQRQAELQRRVSIKRPLLQAIDPGARRRRAPDRRSIARMRSSKVICSSCCPNSRSRFPS